MITFSEAFAEFGHDVEAIAQAMGIPPHEADKLINAKMEQRYRRREYDRRVRADLREIRARAGA